MKAAPKIPISPTCTFGINQTFDTLDSGWRTFPGHYLLYAASGTFHLDVDQARWLLPPQRAAWVAAQVPIRVSTTGPVRCSSVLFTEDSFPGFDFTCRIFSVSTLAREMLLYAARWGPERDEADETANTFFRSLAAVCLELAAHPDEFWLPHAHSAELAAALDYCLTHLAASLTLVEVARAVNVSERTLARRFKQEARMTWRQFMRRARLIRAMELLARPETRVIEVAYTVGFASVSAFNHTFREFTGESPSSYRRRFYAK